MNNMNPNDKKILDFPLPPSNESTATSNASMSIFQQYYNSVLNVNSECLQKYRRDHFELEFKGTQFEKYLFSFKDMAYISQLKELIKQVANSLNPKPTTDSDIEFSAMAMHIAQKCKIYNASQKVARIDPVSKFPVIGPMDPAYSHYQYNPQSLLSTYSSTNTTSTNVPQQTNTKSSYTYNTNLTEKQNANLRAKYDQQAQQQQNFQQKMSSAQQTLNFLKDYNKKGGKRERRTKRKIAH
jgi:hypothetical protein